MGQPNWDDLVVGAEHPHVVLSCRQREWLVTVPEGVIVEVLDQAHEDGALNVSLWENGDLLADEQLPWEGRLDQPIVSLRDPEAALDDLPTAEGRGNE